MRNAHLFMIGFIFVEVLHLHMFLVLFKCHLIIYETCIFMKFSFHNFNLYLKVPLLVFFLFFNSLYMNIISLLFE